MCLLLAASIPLLACATAGAQPQASAQGSPPQDKCVAERVQQDWPREVAASALALEIAQRCAEMLPFPDPCDPGASPTEFAACERGQIAAREVHLEAVGAMQETAEKLITQRRQAAGTSSRR